MAEFEELPPLTLRQITSADNLPVVVEKTQFNFDQILLHGGGKKGEKGDEGKKGVPGATGVGKKGDEGEKGSEIFFTPTDQNDNDLIISMDHREDDVLIDGGGDYFKVFKDAFNNLRYSFKFNINTASTINPYWIDQKLYYLAPVMTNPIVNEHVLFDFGNPTDTEKNLVVARRTDNGGGFDKSEYYRVLLGMDQYPAVPSLNGTLFIANILHDNVQTADQQFFAQIGFKYRDSASANVGANTVWVIYKEESGSNRYNFSVQNQSVQTFWNHDTNDTNDSAYIIKGANTKFIGQSVDIDTVTEWANLNIAVNLTTITTQRSLTLTADTSVGSVLTTEYETTHIKADTMLFDPLAALGITWVASADIDFTVPIFTMIATKVVLDTAAIDIGQLSGATTTVITLNQNMNIVGGKQLDVSVDTGFFDKLRFKSVDMPVDVTGILDVTGITSPIIQLEKNGIFDTVSRVVGMLDHQVIKFVAKEHGIIFKQGGLIDLVSPRDVELFKYESITLYHDPVLGYPVEIDGNYDPDIDGHAVITLSNAVALPPPPPPIL